MPTQTTDECIFCRIATKHEKSFIISEDEFFISFLDKRPVFHGHSLLIPKRHIETFYDLPEETLANFFIHLQKLGNAIQQGLECDGTFIANNNIVSQSVPHVHFHVIPRQFKDGLKGFFWPRQAYESDMHLEEIQMKIKRCI